MKTKQPIRFTFNHHSCRSHGDDS